MFTEHELLKVSNWKERQPLQAEQQPVQQQQVEQQQERRYEHEAGELAALANAQRAASATISDL